mgnify:CR=1 FL=1
MCLSKKKTIAIIGGGASGVFASIRCAEVAKNNNIDVDICVFETTTNFLKKVRISGGGRCNVTHDCFEPRELSRSYPRGEKSLIGPFHRFGARAGRPRGLRCGPQRSHRATARLVTADGDRAGQSRQGRRDGAS